MNIERRHFDIIDSTATWAKENAHLFPKDKMTLVTAEGQTAGRGRFKRPWISPPGLNIYASFCHFINPQDKNLPDIPHVLALATIEVLEKMGFHPELKWPNDIKLGQKKLGGILAETTMIDDLLCIVVSIGLNVNMPLDFIKGISQPATSLLAERSHLFDLEDILHQIKLLYLKELAILNEQGFTPFLAKYRKYIIHTNQVRFTDSQGEWEGVIHAVNPDGSLTLKLKTGDLKTFISGEINE